MRYPRPAKNMEGEGAQVGGPLPMVGGQPVPITATTKHLGPDITSGSQRIDETPELRAKRLAAEEAQRNAQSAKVAESYGVAPEVAAAARTTPMAVELPAAPPTGEGLTGGIRQMPTMPEQLVENERAVKAVEKAEFDRKLAAEAEANAKAAQATKDALDSINQSRKEHSDALSKLSEKPDNGWIHNALSALAVGFGAYGAAKTGSPNFALQIVDEATKQDFERRKAEINAKYDKYMAAGARLKDIEPLRLQEIGRAVGVFDNRVKQIKSAADVTLTKFPEAKLKVDAALAASQASMDKDILAQATASGQIHRNYSSTKRADVVSETTPKDTAARAPVVSGESAKKAMFASKIIDSVKYIREENAKGIDLTDDDLRKLQSNINEMRSQAENAIKGLDRPMWISAMKKAGLTAEKLTEGIPDERAPLALSYLEGTNAVIRDDSGAAVTNYEDLGTAMKKMPQPGEGKKTRAYKLDNMEREGQQRMRAAGPEAAKLLTGKYPEGYEYLEKNRNATPASTTKKPTNADIIRVRDQYKEAASVKPGSPDYDEAQGFMKAAEAKYGKAVR